MAHGGARPNSGPKKGAVYKCTVRKRLIRERIREYVDANLPEILDAAMESARGVRMKDEKGKIFSKAPDSRSIFGLIEHAAGKAPQDVTHDFRAPIRITVRRMEDGELAVGGAMPSVLVSGAGSNGPDGDEEDAEDNILQGDNP